MSATDKLRNSIISKLLAISDRAYLTALDKVLTPDNRNSGKVALSAEQKLMLQLSEDDIRAGRFITQSQLDRSDAKWLKEL